MNKARLFASMASGPLMYRYPDEELGAAAEPVAEVEVPPGEAAEELETEEPAAGAEPVTEEPPPKPRVPWQVKRIGELTAQNKAKDERAAQLEREATEAKAEAARLKALYGDGGAPSPVQIPAADRPVGERTYTQKEFEAETARRANVLALNQKCESLFESGAKTYGGDWNTRVQAAGQAFGQDLQQRPDFFEALTLLPNADAVYHTLTGDLDHFADVLTMTPLQLGMELATMSAAAKTAPPKPKLVSKAPAPIDAIDGNGGSIESMETASMSDYEKDFERRRAARAKEKYG